MTTEEAMKIALQKTLTELLLKDAQQFTLHGDARIMAAIRECLEPFNLQLQSQGRFIAKMEVIDMNDPIAVRALKMRQAQRIVTPIYIEWEDSPDAVPQR